MDKARQSNNEIDKACKKKEKKATIRLQLIICTCTIALLVNAFNSQNTTLYSSHT